MNRKSLLSLGIFGATTILSFTALHVMQAIRTNKWVGVSVALSLFVIMFILLLVATQKAKGSGKKAMRYAALTVNAIADGLAMSSLFTHLGEFPALWQSAMAGAVIIGLFALYLLLTYIPFVRTHYIISMVIYAVAIVGIAIAWCVTANGATKAVSALMPLYMIIFVAFFIPIADNAHNASEHIEKIAYYSFAGLIVAIIVLIIISDGDADFSGAGEALSFGGTSANKKRNPYGYMPYDYVAAGIIANAATENARYDEPPENRPPQPPLKPLI